MPTRYGAGRVGWTEFSSTESLCLSTTRGGVAGKGVYRKHSYGVSSPRERIGDIQNHRAPLDEVWRYRNAFLFLKHAFGPQGLA